MYDNTETKAVLASMLTENTGSHFLDSGGAYGRNWQHNQGKTVESFETESRSVFRATKWGDLEWTHSLFHWLESRLIFSERLDQLFDAYCGLPENEDESWHTLKNEFPAYLRDVLGGDVREISITNTYNGEDMLSQIIEFCSFELDGDPYVLLQIHGGCDARGGYTRPRAFAVSHDNSEYAMYENACGAVFCNHCFAYWDTSNGGYSFDDKGINGDNWEDGVNVPYFRDLTIVSSEDTSDSVLAWYLLQIWKLDHKLDYAKIARVYGDENILFSLPSGEVVCPHCGEGILQGDFN